MKKILKKIAQSVARLANKKHKEQSEAILFAQSFFR